MLRDSPRHIYKARPHLFPMGISDQITEDMKQAMRAKDSVSLTAIRALKAAITNEEKSGTAEPLSETVIISLIRKQVKQRQDSITQFNDAGRSELAANEQKEIDVLEKYLPQALDDEEVFAIITSVIKDTGASSMADMGNVMKAVQLQCAGRADGKTISNAVRSALSN